MVRTQAGIDFLIGRPLKDAGHRLDFGKEGRTDLKRLLGFEHGNGLLGFLTTAGRISKVDPEFAHEGSHGLIPTQPLTEPRAKDMPNPTPGQDFRDTGTARRAVVSEGVVDDDRDAIPVLGHQGFIDHKALVQDPGHDHDAGRDEIGLAVVLEMLRLDSERRVDGEQGGVTRRPGWGPYRRVGLSDG